MFASICSKSMLLFFAPCSTLARVGAMKSGLFNSDAITKECPAGLIKICEGTTAVLLSPPVSTDSGKNNVDATAKRNESHVSKLKSAQLWGGHDNTESGNGDQSVFYNPAQVVNRDLSVCAIETFSQMRLQEPRRRGGVSNGLTILEALSATGLRAIRYYKEISNIRYIIANDLDAGAVECIARNCAYNDVPQAQPTLDENFPSSLVTVSPSSNEKDGNFDYVTREITSGGGIIPNLDDAIDLMHRLALNPGVHAGKRFCLLKEEAPIAGEGGTQLQKRWSTPRPVLQQELMDVVDLDPYGTASPFLDAAFGCIREGGMMLVTSTDSAILCGNYPGTCYAKYGSVPYKAAHCHEMAVRILLACMERSANKHKKYIVPLLSLHIDFYVRCFVRVFTQPAEVKLSASKLGYQLQCTNCPAFWVRPIAVAHPPRVPRHSRKRARQKPSAKQSSLVTQNKEAKVTPSKEGSLLEATVEATSLAGSDAVPQQAESYPPMPSRQDDPKLMSLTLQMLPRLIENDAANSNASGAKKKDCCPVCGASVALSGPIYAAPTQNRDFLTQLAKTVRTRAEKGQLTATARIMGLVQVALEELPECPLFYRLPDLSSYVKTRCPTTPLFVAALARLGYRYSQVHCEPTGIKTDCPPEVLFAVMLRWKHLLKEADAEPLEETDPANATDGSANEHQPKGNSAGEFPRVLVEPLMNANFSYDRQHDFRRQVTGVAKFIPNAPGWGPMRRHQGSGPTANEIA